MNIKPTTESGKKIYNLLKDNNYQLSDSTLVAFCYTEHETDGYLLVNYNATTIRMKLSEINLDELPTDDIKVWATWTFRG